MELRLDRLATLYVMSPFLRLAGGRGQSIPILMYHSIADENESGSHAVLPDQDIPGSVCARR